MKKLQAVLFDLDGTLIDTAPDFIRIIKDLCREDGRDAPSDAVIREQVSAGARAMVKLIFGEKFHDVSDDDAELLAYRQAFLDRYEADICVDSQVFAGLETLLATLEQQGVPWGIVTNKPRYLATNLLHRLALSDRCAVLVCPDDVTNTKPDPEPMYLACDQLGITPKDAIYVGDHIRDIQAGRASGMQTVAVAFGYIVPEEDPSEWGAEFVVATPDDLAVLLNRLV